MNYAYTSVNTTVGDCGQETFAGSLRTSRISGRTLADTIGDICDEPMKQLMDRKACVTIRISKHTCNDKINELIISDNISDGFKGLDNEGSTNPFNPTYINEKRHSDDNEWSNYGKGFTDACKAGSDMTHLVTRYKRKNGGGFAYEKCMFDYQKMARDNTYNPECITITKDQYEQLHPYKTGTSVILKQLTDTIFRGSFKKLVNEIENIIQNKYSTALIKGNENVENSRLKIAINQEEPSDINPIVSPIEDKNHPHPKHSIQMDVRESNDGDPIILLKKNKKKAKWHCMNDDQYKAIDKKKYESTIKKYPNHIGTFNMSGTRTSGTDYQGLPKGSLKMMRHCRTLTNDPRNGGRHMSFLQKSTNGEWNYLYLELSWVEKKLTKFIEENLKKIIDCDLTRLNNIMAEAGKWAETHIRKDVGCESKFKKEWKKKHKTKWDNSKSYNENIAAIISSDEDEVVVEEENPEVVEEEKEEVVEEEKEEVVEEEKEEVVEEEKEEEVEEKEEEAEEEKEEEEEEEVEEEKEEVVEEENPEVVEEEKEEVVEEETVTLQINTPQHITTSSSIRSVPSDKSEILRSLKYLKESSNCLSEDDKDTLIKGPPGHNGLNEIANKILNNKYGSHNDLVKKIISVRSRRKDDYNALCDDLIEEYDTYTKNKIPYGKKIHHLVLFVYNSM